jgi:hypothetical protein
MVHRFFRSVAALAIMFFLLFIGILFGQQPVGSNPPLSSAAVPGLIAFNGVLPDRARRPVTGVKGLTFSLYKDAEGGTALWTEIQNVPLDDHGRYTVVLGATQGAGIPIELFPSGEPRWLGVQAQLPGEQEQPRALLVSVPYALKAVDVDTLGGIPASAFLLATPDIQSVTDPATQSRLRRGGNETKSLVRSGASASDANAGSLSQDTAGNSEVRSRPIFCRPRLSVQGWARTA